MVLARDVGQLDPSDFAESNYSVGQVFIIPIRPIGPGKMESFNQ